MTKKKATLKDISERAGVSAGTVDRVLHNRGEVKEETREKVLQAVKDLNYKPNVAAQLLKLPNSFKIAVLIPKASGEESFWTKHCIGIEQAAENSYPYQCETRFFEFSMYESSEFVAQTKEVLKFKPDGVIYAPLLKDEAIEFSRQLDEGQIPYVFIDTNISEANQITYVGEDALKSGRIAASLIDVIAPTEQDILIINMAKNLGNTQHLNVRNQGFMSYFIESGKNKGLKINIDIKSDDDEVVKQSLDKVFSNNQNIGGVIVSSSRIYAVAKYFEKNNINKCLIGYESIKANEVFLKKGVINFLVSQRPIEQARKAYEVLLGYLSKQTPIVSKLHLEHIDIINKENM